MVNNIEQGPRIIDNSGTSSIVAPLASSSSNQRVSSIKTYQAAATELRRTFQRTYEDVWFSRSPKEHGVVSDLVLLDSVLTASFFDTSVINFPRL